MRNCKIVTSGVSSEYVLGELSSYLRSCDYEVIEIDFANFQDDPKPLLQNLSTEDTVYITSAHMNLTLSLASLLGSQLPEYYPNCLAPIEIIPILKPLTTIYIPHDLLTPYGDSNLQEIRLLDLMDHILTPTLIDKFALSSTLPSTTQVHFAGWIKHTDTYPKYPEKIRTLLFISGIEFLKDMYGVEGLVEYLKPLLTKDVVIKFPAWRNIEKIEQAVREGGEATVVSSAINSIELIKQAEVVICNNASSIHAEATFMGKPTVCLIDKEIISTEEQIQKLQHLPNIHFHDYSERAPLAVEFLDKLRGCQEMPILKSFDYTIVSQIIEQGIIEDD